MRPAREVRGLVPDRYASPAGWAAPEGTMPGWNWVPQDGAQLRRDRVPTWVRAWSRTPFVDRWAYGWMWRRGGFDVTPFSQSDDPGPPAEPSDVPARPIPTGPGPLRAAVALPEPDAGEQ